MRKIILVFVALAFSLNAFSQLESDRWYLSFGVNAVNSLGTRSPINSPSEWAFKKAPVSIAAELIWSKYFSIEQSIAFNEFDSSRTIDGANLTESYNYLAFDTSVKYYYGRFIFPDFEWIDLYVNGGLGIFSIDNINTSLNVGAGVSFWLNDDQNFGIRAQTIAKAALNHSESGFNNNHFQWHLQAIIKL